MESHGQRIAGRILVAMAALAMAAFVIIGPPSAGAVEIGDRAPDFTLPSTSGVDISLKDYRGKKWVFLEFYAAAFVPT